VTGPALDEARAAFGARRFDRAADAAARAAAEESGAGEATALCAAALLADGRPAAALTALGGAASPPESWVLRLRALALLDLGDAESAAGAAAEAARIAPEDPWAHDAVARAAAALGRAVEARAAGLRAVALAPHDPDLRCALGELYAGGNAAVAEGHLRAALALDPACARAWDALGEVLLATGRATDAARARSRAAQIDHALSARRGAAALGPLLWIGAAVFLLVLALGLVPELVRRASPAAAARLALVAFACAVALPTAFVGAAAVALARSRRAAQGAAPPIAAAVRDARPPAAS
jgi:tetratricopeptide (TPR) repeat protein